MCSFQQFFAKCYLFYFIMFYFHWHGLWCYSECCTVLYSLRLGHGEYEYNIINNLWTVVGIHPDVLSFCYNLRQLTEVKGHIALSRLLPRWSNWQGFLAIYYPLSWHCDLGLSMLTKLLGWPNMEAEYILLNWMPCSELSHMSDGLVTRVKSDLRNYLAQS
jgi:hypothetical protein